jgi:hypothetical protein
VLSAIDRIAHRSRAFDCSRCDKKRSAGAAGVFIDGFGGYKQRRRGAKGGDRAAGGDFVSVPTPGASRAGVLAYWGVTPPSSTMTH